MVLVTPMWLSQPWFPVPLHMLVDYPHQLLDMQAGPHSSPTPVGGPLTPQSTVSGRLACLRQSYQAAGLQEPAIRLLMASWRQSTSRNYDSAWSLWERWCHGRHVNPVVPSIGSVLQFFAHEFDKGKEYRSLNVYRSALSSVLAPIDGFPVDKHPLVARTIKGVFQLRPPSQPSPQACGIIYTLARWLKATLASAGIDVAVFFSRVTPQEEQHVPRLQGVG